MCPSATQSYVIKLSCSRKVLAASGDWTRHLWVTTTTVRVSHVSHCASKTHIVKNKSGNLSDSNNYRPIAIATITSKLLESVLLLKCSDYLTTCDNQFGFKASHGTDMCIYTLKEFIDYYKCRGTTVYVTFLDASKAFDRLKYWLLFDKLIKKRVPLFIVKLLLF